MVHSKNIVGILSEELMSQSRKPKSADAPPLTIGRLLGGPALIQGEDLRSYDELLERISTALKPQDPLEEIWIRDIVDLVWETFRLRRARATLITDTTRDFLEEKLKSTTPNASQIADQWAIGGEGAAA
jgi:hypothetical protein